jgi:hypothetical protein
MAKANRASHSHIDALWGAGAIAIELNKSERQTRRLIDSGVLDGCFERLSNGRILGFRSKLRAKFGRLVSDPPPVIAE